MPFPYPASSATTRTRRTKEKDKDSRGVVSSGSGRKHREVSKSSNRTESKALNTSPLSLYSQHNITLDQLPALPESGTVSPSSAASPIYPSSPRLVNSVTRLQSSIYPHTPHDLQQYLDDDSDEPTPLGGPPEPATIPSSVGTYSPQPLHRTAIEEATPRAITASQKSPPTASPRSLSPPQLFKPSLPPKRQASPASPILHQPRPQYQNYLTHPEVYSAGLPFPGGVPNDQFYTVPYPSQYPFPMDQSSGHSGEYHQPSAQPNPFFAGYGSPHAAPLPFGSIRNTPVQGHGSISSGTGLPGEPFTGISQASVPLHGRSIPPELTGLSGQEVVDDPTNLLYRIQSAIPDLHLLLNRYRETSGQVSVREDMIRRTEAQMAEALRQKEAYIDNLGKELETVSQRHSAESSKFRLEIGNLEEKHKELYDNLDASKKSRDELDVAHRALQSEKDLLETKLQGNREIVQRDFDQWKKLALEEFAMKHKRMEDDMQRQSNESRAAVVQERVRELTKTHAEEKEVLQTKLLQQIRELEDNHSRLCQDLEATRKARQRDLGEAQRKEIQNREASDKERDSIFRDFDRERLSLGKGWEEQRRLLAAKHQSEKEDLQSTWKTTQAQINERAEGNIARLQREIEKLKTGWDADKARFVKGTTELKAVAAKLDHENDNLQRMVEAFGEATDFRSKGDTYFIDAFSQLRKQILDLAVEHFKDLQQEPPEYVLKRIPRNVPPFYTNSEASTELRAAYVEHIISQALTQRIFQPFLFTLSRRHGSADSLFQTMSDKLRHKSIRREAIWRQHTLNAAYTVSSAKHSINKVAAVIIEEILGELEHFANPSHMEHITVAVRRIVKIAAETWRYARLEREMITATMAVAEHPGKFGGTAGSGDSSHGAPPEVLLAVLPLIEREPTHQGLRSAANRNDTGCIYSQGVALFSDSPVILARLAELGAYRAEVLQTQDAATGEPGTPRESEHQTVRNPMLSLSPLIMPVANPGEQPVGVEDAMGFDAEAMSTGKSKKSSGTVATEAADQSSQIEIRSAKEGATPRSSTSDRQSPLTANSSSAEVPNWGMARNNAGW